MAARNTTLMMKPTGYKVNLMSAACIIGLKSFRSRFVFNRLFDFFFIDYKFELKTSMVDNDDCTLDFEK